MLLLTVQLPQGATMSDALRELRLAADDVDVDYGLICVDPATCLFALRVTESAATRLTGSGTGATVFADPRIEPAGPEEDSPPR
ncbi:hypothetical protein ACFYTQ_21535 [Nocardia sp. NPDC004068]|uniref:hypothetical protein n=1 Tax=Nocardia sp. NPDC004068 TaxID=3364303 RepID=UPI0036B30FCA